MNDILELLPIPEPRDFPPEQFEAHRAALVAAVRVDAADERLARRVIRLAGRIWLTLLGILALGMALLLLGFSARQRPAPRDAVAVLSAAGTAQIMAAAAPRAGLAGILSTRRPGEASRPRIATR